MADKRTGQLACILGMAMVWPSLHNQLLYPVTFSFHKDGADAPFGYYFIYSAVLLVVALVFAFGNRDQIANRLLRSPVAIAACGIAGAAGISMLVACDFTHDLAPWLMVLGSVLAALFVPVYFTFWSVRILYASERRAGFDLVLSYAVFCSFTAARLALDLHAWPFAIAFPLASGALAVYVLRSGESSRYALKRTAVRTLPLGLIVPCIALVYVATILRTLMNPASATYDYPPVERVVVYALVGALCILFAVLYRPHGHSRRHANLPAFAVTVELLAVGILLTLFSSIGNPGFGNLPAIAGINAIELLIWMFVLVNAQTKHAGILHSAAIYLVFVVGGCHLIATLSAMGVQVFELDLAKLPIGAIAIVLAFVAVIMVNVVLTVMLYRTQVRNQMVAKIAGAQPGHKPTATEDVPEGADGTGSSSPAPAAMPPCLTIAADEKALTAIQATFQLSKRELDTLRLAALNQSAREIAESLFIAESTVNSHLKSIYRKCDVHSRQELRALVSRFKRDCS